MAVHTQFNDNGYKNWLRACLSLQCLKEGIVDFVDAEVKQFHASIINNVCNYVRCNQCTTEQLTNRRHPQRCPNNICDIIRKEIEHNHRFGPCWKNTDATKWCTDYWEIGKCFMSPGYTAVSKATDTDCTGLLSLCINGKFLPPSLSGQITHPSLLGVTPDIFHTNRDARNALLHSAPMSISDAERQDYIDDMIKLLANYKTPVDHVTQGAIDKLNKLNSTNVVILPAVELSILQNKLDDVCTSLTQVEGHVEDQKTDSEEHKQQIHNNSDSLVILSQRFDELQVTSKEDMVNIQDTCKSLHERNEHLKTQMSDLQNRFGEHEAQIENRLGEHAKAIENQELHIKELRTDLTSSTKGTDKVRNIKDIQDFLIAKYKRDELSVPMSPLLRTYNVNVDEVYTELVIRDYLVHNPKGKVKIKSANRGYSKQYWNTERSKSYQEVLYDGETPCKSIYVIGKAGMGKTTWSRKLVATWIEAKEIRKREQKQTENVRILQDYDLVFYISLRHARADHHIMQMIEHQLFRDSKDLLAAVKKVLNEPKYSSRCIIILDGLDEWCSPDDDMSTDGLPVADPTWQCSVITTTRSWKLEALQLQPNKIDRAVEIQGLEEHGIDKLTDHVVATLNKKSEKSKTASDFKAKVTPSIKACMQVPLLLTIFVCLWHDDVSINEHLAGTYTKLIEMLIRCAEGDKRKRLFQKIPKEMLDEMKKNWSSEKSSYPDSLSGAKLFVSYLPFLLRLGKLAFDTLLSGSKESTLVFDYESVEEFICEAELELSLKLGILSQTTERGSVCKETFRLSFLHKTVQEYLMALYMVCGDNKVESLNIFKRHCRNEITVLEMENVLLFTSGLCPETAGGISYHIAEMEPSKTIHKILLRCWRESRAASSTSDHIYIKHHFLYGKIIYYSGENYDEDTMRYLRQATHKNSSMHIEDLRSSRLQTSVLDLSACHSLKELDYKRSHVPIRVPPSLEKVVIEKCKGSTGSVLDLSGCKRLRNLEYRRSNVPIRVPPSLEEVLIEGYTGSKVPVLDLSGCKRLRHLEYKWSSVPIRVPPSLEKVIIEGCTEDTGPVLDLSACKRLRYLEYKRSSVPIQVPPSLEEIKMEGCTVGSMLDLSACKRLRHLECRWSDVPIRIPPSLEKVIIESCTEDTGPELDLSACKRLRNLEYKRSSVSIRIPPSLEKVIIECCTEDTGPELDLSACKRLRNLEYKRSSVPIRIPPSLEEVIIECCTKYTGSVLDLSGCKRLRNLEYKWSNVPIRIPLSLETVVLKNCTESNELMRDLSECQSLRKLHCTECSVPVVPRSLEELIMKKCSELGGSVLDLSGCQSLKKLHYKRSSTPLRVPPSLEEVKVDRLWPLAYMYSKYVIDLSGCQSLRTLTYTRSSAPLRIPARELEVLTTDSMTADLITKVSEQ